MPPVFGRAAITLDIGPHCSFVLCFKRSVLPFGVINDDDGDDDYPALIIVHSAFLAKPQFSAI